MNLEKVSNIIVDQSLKDHVFSKEAGRICYTIVQVSKSHLYITFKLPLFVHPPTLICLTLCLTLSAGWSQAEQWKRVQETLVEPTPAGVQRTRGDEGTLSAGVGVLCHVHLQHLRLPQSKRQREFWVLKFRKGKQSSFVKSLWLKMEPFHCPY